MAEPVPPFAQEAYAILRARFAGDTFPASYLGRFISDAMVKKTLHTLETAGWIRRVERGTYVCVAPDEVFRSMIAFRVPDLLEDAEMPYAYAEASAVEIWSDFTYIQRSWEHSPYYVNVRRKDLEAWIAHFRDHRIKVFVDEVQPALGEFVVLRPKERIDVSEHDGYPVEPLGQVVRYCEKHLDAFEYPLAYIRAKYDVETDADIDERVANEAVKAV